MSNPYRYIYMYTACGSLIVMRVCCREFSFNRGLIALCKSRFVYEYTNLLVGNCHQREYPQIVFFSCFEMRNGLRKLQKRKLRLLLLQHRHYRYRYVPIIAAGIRISIFLKSGPNHIILQLPVCARILFYSQYLKDITIMGGFLLV